MISESANVKLIAISWMVFNCILAAAVPVIIKFTHGDFALSALMAGYNLISTIITICWVHLLGCGFKTSKFHLHFIRCLLATAAYFIYFHAINLTSLANAVAMGYTDAVLTCLFSYILLKEHIHRIDLINLSLSSIGAIIIIKPDSDIVNIGALLAGVSATLWAFSNVVTKVIAKTDSVFTQLFYSNFLMFLFFSCIAIWEGKVNEIVTYENSSWILILGIMACLQSFALFKALNLARASVIMPFFVVTVISGNLFGYIFFREVQGFREMIGTIFVIFVGIYQVVHIRINSKKS